MKNKMKLSPKKLFAIFFSLVYWSMSCPFIYSFELNQLPKPTSAQQLEIKSSASPSVKSSEKTVFYIQDIHAKYGPQLAIASLINELQLKNQIGFVGLEGHEGFLDVGNARSFPQKEALSAVCDYFLHKQMISGPVFAAVTFSMPLPPIYGIEDSGLYQAHLEAYKNAFPFIKSFNNDVKKVRDNLQAAREQALNAELLHFHGDVLAYQAGKKDLRAYIDLLSSVPGGSQIRVQRYKELLDLESSFSSPKVQSEQIRLLNKLGRHLNSQETSVLARLVQSLKNKESVSSEVYQHIRQLCQAKGFSFESYKNLDSFSRYLEKVGQINVEQMTFDMAQAEKSGYSRLVRTAAEKEFIEKEKWVGIASKLINFELTPLDWKEYSQLKRKYFDVLNPNIELFEQFYVLAHRRDQSLANNIVTTMNATKSSSVIVVAGGYHSSGVRQILEKQGINVILMVPKLKSEMLAGDSSNYLEKLISTPPVLNQILSSFPWALAPRPGQAVPIIGGVAVAVKNATHGIRSTNFQLPAGDLTVQPQIKTNPNSITLSTLRLKWSPLLGFGRFVRIMSERFQQQFYFVWNVGPARFVSFSSWVWNDSLLRKLAVVVPVLGSLVFVCGCQAPQHTPVPLSYEVPNRWWSPTTNEGEVKNGSLLAFNDKELDALIQEALRNNPGLKIVDSVTDARLALEDAKASLWPQINIGTSNSLTGNLKDSKVLSTLDFSLASISWEIDVFGRLQSRVQAAGANLEAAKSDLEAAKQLLAAEVARAYFTLILSQKQVELANKQVGVIVQLSESIQARHEAQVTGVENVHNAKSELAKSKEKLAFYQSAHESAARALEILLGRYPSARVTSISSIPGLPGAVPVGLPSDLLRRRPDILSAMARIRQAYSQTEAAYRDRFPSFNLTAQIGVSATQPSLSKLGDSANWGWGVTPGVQARLYDFGRGLNAQLSAEDAEGTAGQVYIRTVNQAFREVEEALSNERYLLERERNLVEARDEKAKVLDLLRQRLDLGLVDIFQVLEISKQLNDIEVLLADVQATLVLNRVSLHLALGGNFWEKPAPIPDNQANGAQNIESLPRASGGSWLKDPRYISTWAWLETPMVFIPVFVIELVRNLVPMSEIVSTLILPSVWFAAPFLFYFGHGFRNPKAMLTVPVALLTFAKIIISIFGFHAASEVAFSGTTYGLLAVFISVTTVVHREIQNEAVRGWTTTTGGIGNLQKLINESVARGRIPRELSTIQAAFQRFAALSQLKSIRGLSKSTIEDRGPMDIIVLDSGLKPTQVAKFIQETLEPRWGLEDKKTLFISDDQDIVNQAKAIATQLDLDHVSFEVLPTIFELSESYQPNGLNLNLLDAFLSSKPGFDPTSSLRLFTRSDLALLSKDLNPNSSLARALVVFLSESLKMATFEMQTIDQMMKASEVINQNA